MADFNKSPSSFCNAILILEIRPAYSLQILSMPIFNSLSMVALSISLGKKIPEIL